MQAVLKRSKDRKVANLVTPNGKQAKIANTFGLPSGKAYSCRGETSICGKICYAGKLERLFPSVRKSLMHNWDALRDASYATMEDMLAVMLQEFVADCNRCGVDNRIFRIHWDGDFFSDEYTLAWRKVILDNPSVQFWVYTRVESSARLLHGIPNLGLYYSTDEDNRAIGESLHRDLGIMLAYLDTTFAKGAISLTQLTGRVGAMCPENKGVMPLISKDGSACNRCGLCVHAKVNVRFSITKV